MDSPASGSGPWRVGRRYWYWMRGRQAFLAVNCSAVECYCRPRRGARCLRWWPPPEPTPAGRRNETLDHVRPISAVSHRSITYWGQHIVRIKAARQRNNLNILLNWIEMYPSTGFLTKYFHSQIGCTDFISWKKILGFSRFFGFFGIFGMFSDFWVFFGFFRIFRIFLIFSDFFEFFRIFRVFCGFFYFFFGLQRFYK